MNRKSFEVWKLSRERQYEIELNALQELFGKNGTATSGFRKRDEKQLRDKYDTEIELERLTMEDIEASKRAWFPNGNWRPFILSTIISILIGVAVFYLTQ